MFRCAQHGVAPSNAATGKDAEFGIGSSQLVNVGPFDIDLIATAADLYGIIAAHRTANKTGLLLIGYNAGR